MTDLATADPPIRLALGDASGAWAVVSGRGCGDVAPSGAASLEDRARILERLGLALTDAVFAQQVHAARVTRVGTTDRGRGAHDEHRAVPETDALVTTESGVALCVQVADCVPVALAVNGGHPDAQGIAAVHAGRSGVQAGVVGSAVAALADAAGVPPGDLVALVGPAVGGCCYEVPTELAVDVAAIVPAARTTSRWGTPALDLPAAVQAQLRASGVQRITAVGSCTRCHHERWYSHRAWQAGLAEGGRQMLAVALPASEPGGAAGEAQTAAGADRRGA